MSFAKLIGNENVKAWFRRALTSGRVPGALIFAGPEGVGKRTFAMELAKSLNCTEREPTGESCDKCVTCRRIDAGLFADVRVITADGQFIKIDQVREVIGEIYYRPFEGQQRIYIFESAERLREQAANALLKTLEEPPATAMIILITASPEALLPTIRSRAPQLRFAPLTRAAMESFLSANYPRPTADIQLLVRLANGSIGRAIGIDLSQYREQRKECLELLDLLVRQRHQLRLLKAAEYFGRKERPEFEARLELLLVLLRDLLCCRLELPDELVNFDIAARLKELAQVSDFRFIADLTEQLTTLQRELVRNLNRQLALEAIFLNLV
ncbi:MAG: DNA polymerase III subunit delta' [Acidobacteriota bacterium]